jgi:hypothetical protein
MIAYIGLWRSVIRSGLYTIRKVDILLVVKLVTCVVCSDVVSYNMLYDIMSYDCQMLESQQTVGVTIALFLL